MKLAGFGLLVSGWLVAVSALGLLPGAGERAVFVVAGLLVEVLGLGLAVRSQRGAAGGSE